LTWKQDCQSIDGLLTSNSSLLLLEIILIWFKRSDYDHDLFATARGAAESFDSDPEMSATRL
jgi:hypothetical protein